MWCSGVCGCGVVECVDVVWWSVWMWCGGVCGCGVVECVDGWGVVEWVDVV